MIRDGAAGSAPPADASPAAPADAPLPTPRDATGEPGETPPDAPRADAAATDPADAGGSSWVVTGTFAGTGAVQTIRLGFSPAAVFVRRADGDWPVATRFASMPAGTSKLLGENRNDVGTAWVQSFTGDGFTVGSDVVVNAAGATYLYTAFRAVASRVATGAYAGNGTAQTFDGLGFSPSIVLTVAAARLGAYWFQGMRQTAHLWGNAFAGGITALPTGFQVGGNTHVNERDFTFWYLAFAPGSGLAVGDFVGNAADDRPIGAMAFPPALVWLQCLDASGLPGHWKQRTPEATELSYIFGLGGPQSNRLQALLPDGFQLGSDRTVNAPGATCHYAAFGP